MSTSESLVETTWNVSTIVAATLQLTEDYHSGGPFEEDTGGGGHNGYKSDWYSWALAFAWIFFGLCILELVLSCCALGAVFWETDEDIHDINIREGRRRSSAITKEDIRTMKMTVTCMVLENVIQLVLVIFLLYGIFKGAAEFIMMYMVLGVIFLVIRILYGLWKICGLIYSGYSTGATCFFCVMVIVIVFNVVALFILFKYYSDLTST